jgi:hypothetical protein
VAEEVVVVAIAVVMVVGLGKPEVVAGSSNLLHFAGLPII